MSNGSSSTTTTNFAGTQNSIAGADPVEVPGINSIKMPDWMSTNPDDHIGELLKTYAGIQTAFDPTKQVQARNNAIAYNTTAGTQAANNAATEYSNRAAQTGTSQLGAGVVKAQAMLPVLAQNAALKTDAADIAAKSHQEGANLAAKIAMTIGESRQRYLQALTGYATDQQKLQMSAGQFNSGLALDKYKTTLEKTKIDMQADEQRRLAAMGLLGTPSPTGSYTTDNQGNVTGGEDFYNTYKAWGQSRDAAQNALRGML